MTYAHTSAATQDSPQSRSLFYRKVCGLPTFVDPTTGRIMMSAGSTGAVMMPADLAQRVKVELRRRNVGPCPIIGHPRAGTWSFLVRADMDPIGDPVAVAQLWRAHVAVVRDGEIALPSPGPEHHIARTWVAPATTPFRPSGTTVLACVRELLEAAKPRNRSPY
ncbi:DNA-directed RNA polymerase subunit beta [Nocardia sp. NPDC051833]|uniref:DNA-directed RNA polymerase subunit beta n=1 Tax=Nocardia sp. NPDC051833 TaxID=3155674 RepID=UPI0034202392